MEIELVPRGGGVAPCERRLRGVHVRGRFHLLSHPLRHLSWLVVSGRDGDVFPRTIPGIRASKSSPSEPAVQVELK